MEQKLYAICLVKNEDDIIEETLQYASRFCDKILVIDNMSDDMTWEKIIKLSAVNDRIVPFARVNEKYRNSLRSYAYNFYCEKLSYKDWWLILDSDEFLDDDPRQIIEAANLEKADLIAVWQVEFHLTAKDFNIHDDSHVSIFRRKYYSITWKEVRLFRNQPHARWEPGMNERRPPGLKRLYSNTPFNRHYRYRNPEQIQKRLNTRIGNASYRKLPSKDWKRYVHHRWYLAYHECGEKWKFKWFWLIYYHIRMRTLKLRLRMGF